MTCARFVNRIERYLNRADGVDVATVNLATERATCDSIRVIGALLGLMAVADAVKPASADAVARLQRPGSRCG